MYNFIIDCNYTEVILKQISEVWKIFLQDDDIYIEIYTYVINNFTVRDLFKERIIAYLQSHLNYYLLCILFSIFISSSCYCAKNFFLLYF